MADTLTSISQFFAAAGSIWTALTLAPIALLVGLSCLALYLWIRS